MKAESVNQLFISVRILVLFTIEDTEDVEVMIISELDFRIPGVCGEIVYSRMETNFSDISCPEAHYPDFQTVPPIFQTGPKFTSADLPLLQRRLFNLKTMV